MGDKPENIAKQCRAEKTQPSGSMKHYELAPKNTSVVHPKV